MKSRNCPSAILLVVIIFYGPNSSDVRAEDKTNVASGFFKKNMVNEMFGSREDPKEETTAGEAKSKTTAQTPDEEENSFVIREPAKNRTGTPLREQEEQDPIAAANDPHAVARALKDSERVIKEVQERVQPAQELPAEASLHSVLSAFPAIEFEAQLKIIARIRQRGAISLKRVYVVGLNKLQRDAALSGATHENLDEDAELHSPAERALRKFGELNLSFDGTTTLTELRARYQVTQFPLWIVEVGNKQHLFPGQQDPATLFSGEGKFIAADRGVLTGQSEDSRVVQHRGMTGTPVSEQEFAATDLLSTVLTYRLQLLRSTPRFVPKSSDSNTLVLELLPQCANDQIRRVKVPTLIDRRSIDIVFYSPRSVNDASHALRWLRATVAYESGASVPLGTPEAVLKRLATSLRVRCLPTRFHFTEEAGVRFLEYREGSGNAWSEHGPD